MVKILPAVRETQVQSLGWEDQRFPAVEESGSISHVILLYHEMEGHGAAHT